MVNLKEEMQTKQDVHELEDSLEGARRATENESSSSPPNPEVAAMAQRRKFSSGEKHRILAEADACKEAGEIGALLRREVRQPNGPRWSQKSADAKLTQSPKKHDN
jgi:hypothetical protein